MNERKLTEDEMAAIIAALSERKRNLRRQLDCPQMGEYASRELVAVDSAHRVISKTFAKGGFIKCHS